MARRALGFTTTRHLLGATRHLLGAPQLVNQQMLVPFRPREAKEAPQRKEEGVLHPDSSPLQRWRPNGGTRGGPGRAATAFRCSS